MCGTSELQAALRAVDPAGFLFLLARAYVAQLLLVPYQPEDRAITILSYQRIEGTEYRAIKTALSR